MTKTVFDMDETSIWRKIVESMTNRRRMEGFGYLDSCTMVHASIRF